MEKENLIKCLTAIHCENVMIVDLLSHFFSNREEILEVLNEHAILFNEGVLAELPLNIID